MHKIPRSIVAIVMDDGERIDVDRLRGLWGYAPQSIKIRRLRKYIEQIEREWMAFESGFNLEMVDGFLRIKKEETRDKLLARFKGKDARNTQAQLAAITKARVTEAARALRAKHTPEHKLRAQVAKDVRISRTRVDQILGPARKTKIRT